MKRLLLAGVALIAVGVAARVMLPLVPPLTRTLLVAALAMLPPKATSV